MTDEFFRKLIEALERTGIAYMVTGSYASAAHGVPRATNDIDIVIAPTAQQLRALLDQFPSDRYYADDIAPLEALNHESQFNVIDFSSGWKADLIIRKTCWDYPSAAGRSRPRVHRTLGAAVRH